MAMEETKSLVRELIEAHNETKDVNIQVAIEKALGHRIKSDTIKVTILDVQECAVVFEDQPDGSQDPIGLIVIDYSEPCLEFKALADE